MAAHLSPSEIPWVSAGFDSCGVSEPDAGWCRIPLAFQRYLHFNLSIDGDNYPPLEDQLFTVPDQYDNTPLGDGGGSDEGNYLLDPVIVWSDVNYSGDRYGYGWNDDFVVDNMPDFMLNRVSSISLQPGWSAVIHPDQYNIGGYLCLSASDSDLSDNVFNNGVPVDNNVESISASSDGNFCAELVSFQEHLEESSAIDRWYGVKLYEHMDFQGVQNYWESGEGWINLSSDMAGKVSSIELEGMSVMVAQGAGGTGMQKCLTVSISDLTEIRYENGDVLNDNISSFSLYWGNSCGDQYFGTRPGEVVTLWSESGYQGEAVGWSGVGNFELSQDFVGHIGSIGVAPEWCVVVYDDLNQTGNSQWFTLGFPEIDTMTFGYEGQAIGKNIKSLKIFDDEYCDGIVPLGRPRN